MGRIRIKKKDAVIPFRETMAYRTILTFASIAAFITALFVLMGTYSTNSMAAMAAGVIGAFAAFGVFYNLDQMRTAKVPKRSMERMKRR